jgi:uncharacterized damage-inducible protein DinB
LRYPGTSGSERELLDQYLDWYRAAIVRKLDGASDETVRASIVSSKTTLLGIVKHLAWVEIWWFQIIFAGRDVEDPGADDPDFDWVIEPGETTEGIIQFYKDACEESRVIVEGAESLDALSARTRRGENHNLRRIMIHMIEETARHAGHADILREIIDGVTGE